MKIQFVSDLHLEFNENRVWLENHPLEVTGDILLIAGDSGIDYWIYGHSHRNIEAQIGNTRILSNQLGYISHGEYSRNGFDPAKHIEV